MSDLSNEQVMQQLIEAANKVGADRPAQPATVDMVDSIPAPVGSPTRGQLQEAWQRMTSSAADRQASYRAGIDAVRNFDKNK